jgi:hypothetical protein
MTTVRITTNDNHTYVVDGVVYEQGRLPIEQLTSHEIGAAVTDNLMFYTYTRSGGDELLIPGNVIRQVSIRYTDSGGYTQEIP